MTKGEIQQALAPATFSPFVTTTDGFAIAIQDPADAFVGLNSVYIRDNQGQAYSIAFRAITLLSEQRNGIG